jgi:hypothetical protein
MLKCKYRTCLEDYSAPLLGKSLARRHCHLCPTPPTSPCHISAPRATPLTLAGRRSGGSAIDRCEGVAEGWTVAGWWNGWDVRDRQTLALPCPRRPTHARVNKAGGPLDGGLIRGLQGAGGFGETSSELGSAIPSSSLGGRQRATRIWSETGREKIPRSKNGRNCYAILIQAAHDYNKRSIFM